MEQVVTVPRALLEEAVSGLRVHSGEATGETQSKLKDLLYPEEKNVFESLPDTKQTVEALPVHAIAKIALQLSRGAEVRGQAAMQASAFLAHAAIYLATDYERHNDIP